jgi:hypothetical protein
LAKYKKVQIREVEVVQEIPIKYYIYKLPSLNYLTPIPYTIVKEQKTELIKLIKFCKDANNTN